MKPESEVRQALRDWVIKTNGKITPAELTDQTFIVKERIVSSVQVMDLILLLEELRGNPIDVSKLKVGVFQNIDTIYEKFLMED